MNSPLSLSNSIKPSIEETERFINYLNVRFNLGIQEDLIVNIQDTSKKAKGFFMPTQHSKHYETTQNKPLNYICINSLYLNDKTNSVYEVIAHELSHYINHIRGFPAKNNYHHLAFKRQAEELLLEVKKGNHGFNFTNETNEFKQMVKDFIPNESAFKIFQNTQDKNKTKSRNLLYECSCGIKIRTAKNEDKPLKAICEYCDSPFKEVIK